jgi:electron transfer flavoprotein alpha subunit
MSVLVVTEQQAGKWHKMSWEALAAGQQVAEALGEDISVAVLGSNGAGPAIDSLAQELAGNQVSRVLAVQHELLGDYTPDGYASALRQVIEKVSPRLVLFPHTYQVRDFGPKLATSLRRPFLSDAIAVRVEEGELVFVRQLFQGKMNADVTLAGGEPYFASIQSGAFRPDSLKKSETAAPIENVAVSLESGDIRTRPGEWFRQSKGEVDLTSADIIVSVGRGIKGPENIPLAEDLAKAIGGEIAASRPICDNGWLPLERQVGSSGQSVSPKLYLALGISGAIQHVVGMKGSKTIAAINQDASAPIFEIADYGIVGDLFEVVPALTEAVKRAKEE